MQNKPSIVRMMSKSSLISSQLR